MGASVYLFLKPAKPANPKTLSSRHLTAISFTDREGNEYNYKYNRSIGIIISIFVGYLSSLLGIGGGIIHVPILVNVLDFPVHAATATSHFILAIMAFSGTVTHIVTGTFGHDVDITLSLCIGVLLGAPLGAYLSNRIKGNWIVRGLALALGLVGLRMLVATL